MSSSAVRNCDTCGFPLPLDASHFDRKRDAPDGFRVTCKQCRKEQNAGRTDIADPSVNPEFEAGLAEASTAIDGRTLRTLQRLTNADTMGSAIPDEAEFLQEFMKRLGGAGGWADHVMANYLAAPLGSQRRYLLLKLAAEQSRSVTAQKKTTVALGDLTNEDLNALHEKYLEEMASRLPRRREPTPPPTLGTTIDVPAQHAE